MLFVLLLEVATNKSVTTTIQKPFVVYATLGAALFAALASLNATRISARTAREVGSLAAQTARDSARVASETAREIKGTEYKHDYYKKIIDKRIQAIEASQLIVSLLHEAHRVYLGPPEIEAVFDGESKPGTIMIDAKVVYPPASPVFSLFSDSYLIGEYDKNIRSYQNSGMWLNSDTSEAMGHLTLTVKKVRTLTQGLDLDQAQIIVAEYFNLIHSYVIKVSACLDSDLISLHDVDAFFVQMTDFHKANRMGSMLDGDSILP